MLHGHSFLTRHPSAKFRLSRFNFRGDTFLVDNENSLIVKPSMNVNAFKMHYLVRLNTKRRDLLSGYGRFDPYPSSHSTETANLSYDLAAFTFRRQLCSLPTGR